MFLFNSRKPERFFSRSCQLGRFFFFLYLACSFLQGAEELVILGSGPAGLTAALYAGRFALHPLVIEGESRGGQLAAAHLVENFPGFPEGVPGSVLMEEMRKQAEKFGARFLGGKIDSVDLSKTPFYLHFSDGEELHARALIIATGSSPKRLGIASEKALFGRGISTCATCDGYFFRGKDVAILGGGDSAVEEALYLARLARVVTLIHRRNELKAHPFLQGQLERWGNIALLGNHAIEEILDPLLGRVTGVKLHNLKSGGVVFLKVDALFLAIGHEPNTALFRGQLDLDERGYLITHFPGTSTNVPGVFAAGDVVFGSCGQAVSAAASGCRAAIDAAHFLRLCK